MIERHQATRRVRLCSQSYEGIRLAKQSNPDLTIGYIAGAAVGDLSRLDVDSLMVRTSLATPRLVTASSARGLAIHVWTVNDPDQLPRLLDRGVANVITDDPRAMRTRLLEVRGLGVVPRLLLKARSLVLD